MAMKFVGLEGGRREWVVWDIIDFLSTTSDYPQQSICRRRPPGGPPMGFWSQGAT